MRIAAACVAGAGLLSMLLSFPYFVLFGVSASFGDSEALWIMLFYTTTSLALLFGILLIREPTGAAISWMIAATSFVLAVLAVLANSGGGWVDVGELGWVLGIGAMLALTAAIVAAYGLPPWREWVAGGCFVLAVLAAFTLGLVFGYGPGAVFLVFLMVLALFPSWAAALAAYLVRRSAVPHAGPPPRPAHGVVFRRR